jgi:hypothetical protein
VPSFDQERNRDVPDTDPNQVRLTGENSFIRLHETDGGPQLTRVSHWRILYSPAGAGHALFIQSDVTGNAVRVYSDNAAMTRWLQGEIESLLYAPFADESLPIAEAAFSRSGDTTSTWTEVVEAGGARIELTWTDVGEPFMLTLAAGSVPNRPHGVYSCFIPARSARVTVDGQTAAGRPFPQTRGDKQSSTACLALSETWTRP